MKAILIHGYKTFRRGNWRFQVYFPAIWIRKKDISLRFVITFRVSWGKYKALAGAFGFGVGFDYYKDEEVCDEN